MTRDEPGEAPAGPLCIGWKEHLDFPEWGLRHVKVKVDTGARTSALDVEDYELLPTSEGGTVARLRLALHRRRPHKVVWVEAPVLRVVEVCNSSGVRERRPLIEALVRLGPVQKCILVTIANRKAMRFRMILGRQALAGDFVVDVSRKYLLRK
jgi:hypothetical protein